MAMEQSDLDNLIRAKALLEQISMAARITQWLGKPIEKGFEFLPVNWKVKIGEISQTALIRAVSAAVFTMKDEPGKSASNTLHRWAVAATGGFGGFFGLPALAVELPISTTLMLRSIAEIARSEHEPIHQVESKIACVEVFALGGPKGDDDSSDTGYFAIRAGLAHSVSRATEHIAQKGLSSEGAPAVVRLIVNIAERFSIQVSEKAAAQAIPAIGAAGGAVINTLFMDHFQKTARGHFIIRRLEKKYGKRMVEETYKGI